MRLLSLHVRRFRSIESASLADCGPLNVLIGKNNAGKSNVLATIDLLFSHLRTGKVAATWSASRAADEFTDRDTTSPIQIGAELELPEDVNEELRGLLAADAPHLEKSIDQIRGEDRLAIVIGCQDRPRPFVFVEQMTVGRIDANSPSLKAVGINLLRVPAASARELFQIQTSADSLRADLESLKLLDQQREMEMAFTRGGEEGPGRSYWVDRWLSRSGRHQVTSRVVSAVTDLVRTAANVEEARAGLTQLALSIERDITTTEQKQIESPVATFAGETRVPPAYALWLMKEYGELTLLHLRETKHPIGRAEAEALLSLKIRRGGPERLAALQQTVRALLGVEVDAFAAEGTRGDSRDRGAEMDIDQFLVEANGAGIREALRLILDLELRNPSIALIEEPEVHLHPGLERAVESYLRQERRCSDIRHDALDEFHRCRFVPARLSNLQGRAEEDCLRGSRSWQRSVSDPYGVGTATQQRLHVRSIDIRRGPVGRSCAARLC